MPISLIVFSKDRACQLDLLLRSIDINKPADYETFVIYAASNDQFDAAYDLAHSTFPLVKFIKEKDFAKDIIGIVSDSPNSMVSICTDDSVFYRKTQKFDLEIERGHVFIPRSGFNTIVQNPLSDPVEYQPALNSYVEGDKYVFYNPHDLNPYHNYGYVHSNDGNIYNRVQFLEWIQKFQWHNSNTLEGGLQRFRPEIVIAAMFKQSILVNIPANNISGYTITGKNNRGVDYLNQQFLMGRRLSLSSFSGIQIVGCHQDIHLKWKFHYGVKQ